MRVNYKLLVCIDKQGAHHQYIYYVLAAKLLHSVEFSGSFAEEIQKDSWTTFCHQFCFNNDHSTDQCMIKGRKLFNHVDTLYGAAAVDVMLLTLK